MAKKTAVLDVPTGDTSGKPVKGQKRVNKDGTPFVPGPRRPNNVIIADWKVKRDKLVADHAVRLEKIDKRIAFFTSRGAVDPAQAAAAAAEMLSNGMTPEQISELRAKLALAEKGLKDLSPEQIEALRAESTPKDPAEDEAAPDA